MNTLYNFATGPWRGWRLWCASAASSGGCGLTPWLARMRDGRPWPISGPSILSFPFFAGRCPTPPAAGRANPRLTLASFILHLGLFVSILFYSGHNVMWDYNFGFSLPSLPDLVVSILVFAAILACIFLGVRRLYISAASHVVTRRPTGSAWCW